VDRVLAPVCDGDRLREAYASLNREAAPDINGVLERPLTFSASRPWARRRRTACSRFGARLWPPDCASSVRRSSTPESAQTLVRCDARSVAGKRVRRALSRRRGTPPPGPAANHPLLGSHPTAAQSASSSLVAADGRACEARASPTSKPASVSRATPVRHHPRQEPGAVVPHAGILPANRHSYRDRGWPG
jgi:hypothetical protein